MASYSTEMWEPTMKSWFVRGMLAAAIGLPALSGPAQADNDKCSNATLKGLYAFGATNLTIPQVVAGIKVFDGRGNLTQRDYIGDSLRTMRKMDFALKGQ